MEVRSQSGSSSTALLLTDPGSTDNFITHSLARQLLLPSTQTTLYIRVIDEEYREKQTSTYKLSLVDRFGLEHEVEAIGMNSLTEVLPLPEVSKLAHLFPEAPDDAAAAFSRPSGTVSFMLGMRDRRLHSTDGFEHQDLRLNRSKFGCGWVLTGFSPLLATSSPAFSPEVLHASGSSRPPHLPVQTFFLSTRTGPRMGFLEAEELGITPAPACNTCKGCKDCKFRRKVLTTHDAEVVSRIEKEMTRDPETGILTASYPWKPCKERMRDNRNQIEKIQRRIETSMHKQGTFSDFEQEMEKAFASGSIRELSVTELEEWSGPIHYLSLFPVFKETSVSTKCRIVSNSALVNALSGLSLNDCLWTGPNALAELLTVLLHWRSVEVALVSDIVKAYHAIHTREDELHLRRFLWRNKPSDLWKVCAFTRATFGDSPAGLLLEIAKKRAADLGESIDPEAARQLREKTYVDDQVSGGSAEDVKRMRGQLVDG